MEYFHQQIFGSNNKEAKEYLLKRGLEKNTIEEFQLGYVPWQNNFHEELLKKYNEFVIAKDNLKAGERLVITKLSTASNGITVNPIYQ